ncbi:MAG: YggS family pyridoxal phosphate-dependent enzyme, partial [Christensenellaceae bacterium]|nr:YggS family pyridoxal phosphate-dependent enzyme [Christensenellaceae bacterium]
MAFAQNLDMLLERVSAAAVKSGRNLTDIEIVPATKTHGKDLIAEIIADGRIKTVGENRVQEFADKFDPRLNFDLIGQLQTNKVKYIADKVRLIHSCDREPLLAEINKRAVNPVKVLIEINTGA